MEVKSELHLSIVGRIKQEVYLILFANRQKMNIEVIKFSN